MSFPGGRQGEPSTGWGTPAAQGWVHSVIVYCSPHPRVCSVTICWLSFLIQIEVFLLGGMTGTFLLYPDHFGYSYIMRLQILFKSPVSAELLWHCIFHGREIHHVTSRLGWKSRFSIRPPLTHSVGRKGHVITVVQGWEFTFSTSPPPRPRWLWGRRVPPHSSPLGLHWHGGWRRQLITTGRWWKFWLLIQPSLTPSWKGAWGTFLYIAWQGWKSRLLTGLLLRQMRVGPSLFPWYMVGVWQCVGSLNTPMFNDSLGGLTGLSIVVFTDEIYSKRLQSNLQGKSFMKSRGNQAQASRSLPVDSPSIHLIFFTSELWQQNKVLSSREAGQRLCARGFFVGRASHLCTHCLLPIPDS